MHKNILSPLLLLFFITLSALPLWSHCEVPCGIYHDDLRISDMEEDITTLEKAMTQIIALGEQDGKTANQRVRWILNKEKHAEKLQATIWQYFMTQRIKPVDAKTEGYDKYIAQLTLLHLLSVQAMKAKQSVDLTIITSMRATLHDFSHLYLGKEKK